jgi:hypothetical protein
MGWPRISEEEAIQAMQDNDLDPLVPYPGSTQPWPSKCLRCGKTVQPTVTKVRQRGHQCVYCAGQRIDEEDAIAILEENQLTPISDYPGASRKWRVHCGNCGHDTDVVLAQVKAGRRCAYCTHNKVDEVEALALMRERGLEPLTPYPGDVPWPSVCLDRGHEVSPRLVSVRAGHGCNKCAIERRMVTTLDVDEVMAKIQEFNLEPLEPFVNYSTPWRCRCLRCNREVKPTWGRLMRSGSGCSYCSRKRVDLNDALSRLELRKLTPLVEFPGANKPWLCKCKVCDSEVTPRYADLKSQSGCVYCAMRATRPEDAVEKMRAVGLEPITEYPGANRGWPCTCQTCGQEVRPHYSSIQQGRKGCRFCADKGIDYTSAGYLYLITHEELRAHKIGIANFAEDAYEDRVSRHMKHGWIGYKATTFDSTEAAFQVEQRALKWLRQTKGLPPAVDRGSMPQGGWTETVAADSIDVSVLWRKILSLKRSVLRDL